MGGRTVYNVKVEEDLLRFIPLPLPSLLLSTLFFSILPFRLREGAAEATQGRFQRVDPLPPSGVFHCQGAGADHQW